MAVIIVNPPGSGSGGLVAWGDVTGKPAIATTVSNPGSDSSLPTEQAVREIITETNKGGMILLFPAPENVEYVISGDWPVGTSTNIVKVSYQCSSGTVELTLKINGVNVTGAVSLAVSSTPATATISAANTLAQGNVFSISFANAATPENVSITLRTERVV